MDVVGQPGVMDVRLAGEVSGMAAFDVYRRDVLDVDCLCLYLAGMSLLNGDERRVLSAFGDVHVPIPTTVSGRGAKLVKTFECSKRIFSSQGSVTVFLAVSSQASHSPESLSKKNWNLLVAIFFILFLCSIGKIKGH